VREGREGGRKVGSFSSFAWLVGWLVGRSVGLVGGVHEKRGTDGGKEQV